MIRRDRERDSTSPGCTGKRWSSSRSRHLLAVRLSGVLLICILHFLQTAPTSLNQFEMERGRGCVMEKDLTFLRNIIYNIHFFLSVCLCYCFAYPSIWRDSPRWWKRRPWRLRHRRTPTRTKYRKEKKSSTGDASPDWVENNRAEEWIEEKRERREEG